MLNNIYIFAYRSFNIKSKTTDIVLKKSISGLNLPDVSNLQRCVSALIEGFYVLAGYLFLFLSYRVFYLWPIKSNKFQYSQGSRSGIVLTVSTRTANALSGIIALLYPFDQWDTWIQ